MPGPCVWIVREPNKVKFASTAQRDYVNITLKFPCVWTIPYPPYMARNKTVTAPTSSHGQASSSSKRRRDSSSSGDGSDEEDIIEVKRVRKLTEKGRAMAEKVAGARRVQPRGTKKQGKDGGRKKRTVAQSDKGSSDDSEVEGQGGDGDGDEGKGDDDDDNIIEVRSET